MVLFRTVRLAHFPVRFFRERVEKSPSDEFAECVAGLLFTSSVSKPAWNTMMSRSFGG